MTDYYVRTSGDDDAAGTSPATAWLTISKAMGTAGIGDGDTVYIGAGVYREKVTCALATPTTETFVIGDVDGSHTGDAGEIRITNYLTDDKTAPTDQNLLDLNGCDYLTFQTITFQHTVPSPSGISDAIYAPAVSQYIKILDCSFVNTSLGFWETTDFVVRVIGAIDTPYHWLIDRCKLFCAGTGGGTVRVDGQVEHTENVDGDFIIRNSIFVGGGPAIWFGASVAGENPSIGGLMIQNCFMFGSGSNNINIQNISLTTTPCRILGNMIFAASGVDMFGGDPYSFAGVIEDSNHLFGYVDYTILTPGAHTVSDGSYAPMFHFGQELQQSLSLRPFSTPTADSPQLGFCTGDWLDAKISQTQADDGSIGTIAWIDVGNAKFPGTSSATTTLLTSEVSHYIKLTNFGFSIPGSATILGVMICATVGADTDSAIEWNNCKLVKGGVIGGTNQAPAGTFPLVASLAEQRIGGASNLWGQTLEPSDVNDSGFGVALAVDAIAGAEAYLDFVKIIVYYSDTASSVPDVDALNRPRPAGGQSALKAAGAYERHDTAIKEETVFDVTPGIKIVGPGDHDFYIPVDATATTISVKARYDTNHGSTNKPQAILLAAPEIGITAETKTMTEAADTWEQLVFTQFTPTAKGVVTVRLVSRAAAGNGVAYFDTFAIA